jgi:hypothetical protein
MNLNFFCFKDSFDVLPDTIGLRFFAECLPQALGRHSAKAYLHSTKNTQKKIDRQRRLCRVPFVEHSAPAFGKKMATTAP